MPDTIDHKIQVFGSFIHRTEAQNSNPLLRPQKQIVWRIPDIHRNCNTLCSLRTHLVLLAAVSPIAGCSYVELKLAPGF